MATTTSRQSDLAAAREAISEIAPAFVRLARNAAYDGPVVGHWGVADVARHMCVVLSADTDSLAGRPLPVAELNPRAVAAMSEDLLAADPETDLDVLADRMEALFAEFFDVSASPPSDECTWLGGVRLPASAVACHLLEELLVHGFDLAAGRSGMWTIAPAHAALALTGAGAPIINAADPYAFVNTKRATGFRARFDARIRGYQRMTFEFDDGMRIGGETSEPVDAHISGDPVTVLLLMLGRISPVRAALRGKIVVWGRRPWRLRRMLGVITPP